MHTDIMSYVLVIIDFAGSTHIEDHFLHLSVDGYSIETSNLFIGLPNLADDHKQIRVSRCRSDDD